MTVLENVTSGVSLYTGTILPDVISLFSAEPLVYFVAGGLVLLAVVAIRRLLMPSGY